MRRQLPLSSRPATLALAAVALFVVVMLGEAFLSTQRRDQENQYRMDAISQAATLRARLERELNTLLYLSSGLGGYLVVRSDSLEAKEVNDILAVIYRNSRHVRNFGVAVGYRLTYVYPVEGNEKAIGLYYPDHPAQWSVIQRIVETRKSALAGPVGLVQGGNGLIYRVPLSIGERYWGLLSTVIDSDSLFKAIFEEADNDRYEFAIRGKDAKGMEGDVIRGDLALFADPDAAIQKVDIPGGQWAIAVKTRPDDEILPLSIVVRLASAALGLCMAWILYTLVRHRAELAHFAMYDSLTGLPNRRLLEDRAQMALARHSRNPEQKCVLLFLDLDGFKDINDSLGHKAGDAVLRTTAERARLSVRNNDTVARWGGDEFIVLLENISDRDLEELVARLRANLEIPVNYEGREINLGVSIGTTPYPAEGGNLEELLKAADKDMYDDKAARKAERLGV